MEINDLGLLQTRLAIARRNTYIAGTIFLFSFIVFFVAGMLRSFGERELMLVSTILVAFGFSLVIALIKYEVAKALTDFAGKLSRDNKTV